MGGKLSLTAASHRPERVAAAASFHGGYLVTDAPDSPHLAVGSIAGRVYVAGAPSRTPRSPRSTPPRSTRR